MGFGNPNFGNGRKAFPQNPKEGDNVWRILPPILSCEKDGTWAIPYATHMESTPQQDNPDKKNFYTYECVEKSKFVNKERVILQHCPKDVEIARRKDEYESEKKACEAAIKAGKMTKDQAITRLRPLSNWLKYNGREFKWYLNVKTLDGKYETKKVPNKVKVAIDKLRDTWLQKKKWDIIRPDQGLWIVVNRTGEGISTEYKVSEYQTDVEVNGQTYQQAQKAPLAEVESEAAEAQCWDLKDLGFHKLTLEQVQTIVDANGDADTIDAVFSANTKKETLEQKTTGEDTTLDEMGLDLSETSTTSAPTPAAPAETAGAPASAGDPAPAGGDEDDLLRQAAELTRRAQAAKAAKAAAAAANKPAPAKAEAKPSPAGSSGKPAESQPAPKAAGGDDLDAILAGDLSAFIEGFGTADA